MLCSSSPLKKEHTVTLRSRPCKTTRTQFEIWIRTGTGMGKRRGLAQAVALRLVLLQAPWTAGGGASPLVSGRPLDIASAANPRPTVIDKGLRQSTDKRCPERCISKKLGQERRVKTGPSYACRRSAV